MREILIFLGGAMFGGFVAFLTFGMLAGIRMKSETKKKGTARGIKQMFRRKLCPHCKTGKYTYELDSRSTECPYLCCHNGRKCAMYVPLESKRKTGFFRRFWGKELPATKN